MADRMIPGSGPNDLEILLLAADGIVDAATTLNERSVTAAAPQLFQSGLALTLLDEPHMRALGLSIMLDVMLRNPDALLQTVRQLHTYLCEHLTRGIPDDAPRLTAAEIDARIRHDIQDGV